MLHFVKLCVEHHSLQSNTGMYTCSTVVTKEQLIAAFFEVSHSLHGSYKHAKQGLHIIMEHEPE
jgi:hypothetical protein